ncbi:MAG: LPXTG cell wall anchor domain-containing protein [Streptococcus sp.]|nr:MAG: LPXTG cell wall anchor domain-containing protein [Streptococcus sp.]
MKKRNHASKMALLAVFASGIFVGSNVTYAENNTSSTATPVVEVKPVDGAGTGSSSSSGTGAAVTPDPVVPAKPIDNGTDADNNATSPVTPTNPVADNTTANPVTPDPAASTATSGSSSATTDPATPTKPAKPATSSSSSASSKNDKTTSATSSSQAAKPTVPDPATPPVPSTASTTVTRAVVSPTAPVTTESGVQIIGTDGGNVIIADGNGGSRTVAPEEVGAKKNSDGTISVKTKEKKLETLPETGTAESLAVSAVGVLTLVGGLYLKKRATEE